MNIAQVVEALLWDRAQKEIAWHLLDGVFASSYQLEGLLQTYQLQLGRLSTTLEFASEFDLLRYGYLAGGFVLVSASWQFAGFTSIKARVEYGRIQIPQVNGVRSTILCGVLLCLKFFVPMAIFVRRCICLRGKMKSAQVIGCLIRDGELLAGDHSCIKRPLL